MEHFLELTANDIFAGYADPIRGLSHITMVFPNRRARLFFDEYLSQRSDRPVWSPSYMTIAELFESQSTLETADQFKLVSTLYRIYCEEMHSDETIDSFWNWGELMLNDFDDIDRNLADADGLFACLQNHKEIAGQSFLSDEQTEILKSFFNGFNGRKTDLKEKYINVWNSIGRIYHRFRENLKSSGIAYEGMMQREVVTNLDTDAFSDRMFAFVGFNSLNKAEKMLFHKLKESGKAIFYWDYDKSYIEDSTMEAGLFMRDNLEEFPNQISPEHFDNLRKQKQFTIIETSSDSSQAHYISTWLDSLGQKPDKDTAIVLCDSGLLQSVLHSIPDGKAEDVNITMGFPLSSIPLQGFVSAYLDIQRMLQKSSGRLTIGHIGRMLNNPMTLRISPKASEFFKEMHASRQYYPDISALLNDDVLKILFTPCTDNISIIDSLLAALQELVRTLAPDSEDTIFQPLYSEAIYRIYTQASRFRSLIEEGTLDISAEMMCKLLQKVMRSTTVPFHGEPVVGMQVMGMIETRNLDFKNVLLFSAAEGTLPSNSAEASFIPYSIRMAFGMTTMREKSAVASYNFHHLLQRAENVTMMYNSNTDTTGIGKGQISRYLLQLIVSDRPVRRIAMESEQCIPEQDTVRSVAKTDDVIQRLVSMYDTADKKNYISPSALSCYIECKYKYYLQYVAGIRAKRDETVEIDAGMFGSLFHESAQNAYDDLARSGTGQIITSDAISALLKNEAKLKSYIRSAFNKLLFNGKDVPETDFNGTQAVNFMVILRYLKQVLSMDMKSYSPFRYIGSEASGYSHIIEIPYPDDSSQTIRIRISGRIDRMDCKNNIYRIVDYKTGTVEKEAGNIEELFTAKSESKKHTMQTFYYAMLVHYQPEYSDKKLGTCLIYIRNSSSADENNLYLKVANEPVTDFAGQYLDEFESGLKETIGEIFNRDVPFSQTENNNTCNHCDFKSICNRGRSV